MKKFLGILLAVIMLFLLAPSAFATSQTTLNFNLTCDGKNEVSKKTGDIVTVVYTLENMTDESAAYDISSLTNEIYYDHTFFELVEGSSKVEVGLNQSTRLAVYSWGEHRVYFNGFEIPTKQYAAKQVIGTFQLKIIAAEGSSTLRSLDMVAYGDEQYAVRSSDLVVKIGDAPVTPVYELTFQSNGGSTVFSVKKEAGTAVDLTDYTPVKTGYDFAGWYSDEALTIAVDSVQLTDHTTVYAKWTEKIPVDGQTPYIGSNGNWWIGTTDTGVKAEGTSGANGQDGKTPYIGENGNWFIGNIDTGVKAQGSNGQDGKDGIGVERAEINSKGELVITLSDGKVLNAGKISHIEGQDGIGIQSVIIDGEGNLIVTLTDGSVINAGSVDLATYPVASTDNFDWIYILLLVTVLLGNAGWIVLLITKRRGL